MKPVKYKIECTGSGRHTYDEFHMTEEDMLNIVREHVAAAYDVAMPRVKVDKSNRSGCSVCFRVELLEGDLK